MSNSINFNGTDLSGENYALTIIENPMGFSPSLHSVLTQIPFKHGAYDQLGYYMPRYISLDGFVRGTSHGDLQTKMHRIATILNQVEPKQLKIDFYQATESAVTIYPYFLAKLNSPFEITQYVGKGKAFVRLNFVCPDPFSYSTTETSTEYAITTDPDTFEITPNGSARVELVWRVYNNTGGNVTDITLENAETSDSINWQGTLANTKWLYIDSVRQIVENDGSADMADVTGTFPDLLPGMANTINIDGVSTGTLKPVFRARYL